MYISIEDFLTEWKAESEATMKVLNNLTSESLGQKVYPEGRTLGYIAWHLVDTIVEMFSKTGIEFKSIKEGEDHGDDLKLIQSGYRETAEELSRQLSSSWSDDMLNDELNLYGEKWKRRDLLSGLVLHQIHHRGQMTVLMRQAGLKVPGVYGPSKEEWAEYGMTAPK